jgi:acetaldehyde dehydrogenase/alcohol dehydrogenase
MSEIKQMYLNAYYGKSFEEADTPDEHQFGGEIDKQDAKQSFRRAVNGIHQNL